MALLSCEDSARQLVSSLDLCFASEFVDLLHGLFVQLQSGGSYVFFQVIYLRRPRNRENHGRAPQQPCESELRRCDFQLSGDTRKFASCLGHIARSQRKPRNKTNLRTLAIFQNVFGGAVEHAVAVLHRDNFHDGPRVFDLRDAHFREPDVFYFAFGLKRFQRSKLIFRGNFAVDAVKLEQINSLEAQALETSLASRAQIFGTAVRHPFIRTRTFESRFRCDHQARRVWVECFGNNFLAYARAVRIGGVDKINSERDGIVKNADGFVAVLGLAPNSFAGDSHRAVAEAVDAQVASNLKFSRLCRGKFALRLFSGCRAHICSSSRLHVLSHAVAERPVFLPHFGQVDEHILAPKLDALVKSVGDGSIEGLFRFDGSPVAERHLNEYAIRGSLNSEISAVEDEAIGGMLRNNLEPIIFRDAQGFQHGVIDYFADSFAVVR